MTATEQPGSRSVNDISVGDPADDGESDVHQFRELCWASLERRLSTHCDRSGPLIDGCGLHGGSNNR